MRKKRDLTERTRQELMTYKNASFDAIRDGQAARDGKRVLYSPDFNIVHPYMWEALLSHSRGHDAETNFYDYVGRNTFTLESLYRNESGFNLTFSDLTLVEVVESISHRHDQFSRVLSDRERAGDIFSGLKRTFSTFETMVKADPEEALKQLKSIAKQLPNGAVKKACDRIIMLFDSGTVVLLSNVIDPEALAEAAALSRDPAVGIVDQIRRSRHEREHRSFEHAQAHYRVDALNMLIPKFLNQLLSNNRVWFVGKRQIRRFAGDDGHTFTRNPLAPFLKLVSIHNANKDAELSAESEEWLAQVHEQAVARLRRVDEVDNIGELTPKAQLYIDSFYRDYVRDVIDYETVRVELDKEQERISGIIRNESSFLEHFDQAKSDAEKGSKAIVDLQPSIVSDEFLEEYDLAENEHLKEVYQKLGLSLK